MPGARWRLIDILASGLRRRSRLLTIVTAVVVAHLGLYAGIASNTPVSPGVVALPAAIIIELLDPPVVKRAPAPTRQDETVGGGAPSSPSRVRVAPSSVAPEVTAPPTPSPEADLNISVSDESSPSMGTGQGAGTGDGSGRDEGAGSGQPPRLLTGPTISQIRALHPRAALMARRSGRGVIACRIRLDTRLEACRLVEETPPGEGFGRAALQAAPYFRFRPPMRADGTPLSGQEVTFGLDFGPPREEPDAPRR